MGDAVTVAGSFTANRQRALRRLYDRQKRGSPMDAKLVREPLNRHDENAIMVFVGLLVSGGDLREMAHIGYIPKPRAAELRKVVQAGLRNIPGVRIYERDQLRVAGR